MSVNLETSYLGLTLSSPLVVAASPLGRRVASLRRLEEAGAAAVVLPSLFEEQIEHDSYQVHAALESGAGIYQEAAGGYLPEAAEGYTSGSERYLALVKEARAALQVPVIASLNGVSAGGWVGYARKMEEAGASALELNVYFIAADADETGEQVERRYLDLVAAVRRAVGIPLAVKVGPYFSSMANMARRLVEAGADGLVLFNRFYQPDIDLEDLKVRPNVELSTSAELRLPLRWIAILKGRVERLAGRHHRGAHRRRRPQAGDGGGGRGHVGLGLAEAGAGLAHQGARRDGLLDGGARLRLHRADEGLARARRRRRDPAAFERANYMESLITYATPTL